ncbi:MAG TPA: hypothetical protein VHC98_01185 [Candidatus Saccharimonadales bacterium]|nr:hypothetical protein [Candidatus Saccharimonadales bacterium]
MKVRHRDHLVNKFYEQLFCGPDSPLRQEFVRQNRELSPSLNKLAMMAVELATNEPLATIARRAAAVPYERHGMHLFGSGYFSTVVRQDDEVLKIHRNSAHQDRQQNETVVKAMAAGQELVRQYIGSFALTQRFSIEPHPLRPDVQVIMARQPFVAGLHGVDLKRLESLSPMAMGQLRDFCAGARAMVDEKRFVPDLAGDGNLGFDAEDRLCLVDTVPLMLAGGPDTRPETSQAPAAQSLSRLALLEAATTGQ